MPAAEQIDLYRRVMTPSPASDWESTRLRLDAANVLARSAYLDGDPIAREISQVVQFRLQTRNLLRPTEMGDVGILDLLYRHEEEQDHHDEAPPGLTPQEFCAYLNEAVMKVATPASAGAIDWMASGGVSRNEWRYLAYQTYFSVQYFTRTIATTTLRIDRAAEGVLFQNLWDECGHGAPEHGHFKLYADFVRQFGHRVDDEEALEWVLPEAIHQSNAQFRLNWRRDPRWGLAALFVFEGAGPVFSAVLKGLEIGGMDYLDYWRVHAETDPGHAAMWLAVIESYATDRAGQTPVLSGALTASRSFHRFLAALRPGLEAWQRTGVPPRCPASELLRATGH